MDRKISHLYSNSILANQSWYHDNLLIDWVCHHCSTGLSLNTCNIFTTGIQSQKYYNACKMVDINNSTESSIYFNYTIANYFHSMISVVNIVKYAKYWRRITTSPTRLSCVTWLSLDFHWSRHGAFFICQANSRLISQYHDSIIHFKCEAIVIFDNRWNNLYNPKEWTIQSVGWLHLYHTNIV